MTSQLNFNKKIDILIDGIKINNTLETTITEIKIKHNFQMACECQLQLVLTKNQYENQAINLTERSQIVIIVQSDTSPIFSGYITSFAHHYSKDQEFSIQITAYDELYFLSLEYPVRSFVDVTLIDIAEQMMSGYGVEINALESGPLWSHLVQYQSSSLEFLQELSERSGLYFTLNNNVLSFVKLAIEQSPLQLDYRSNLLEVVVKNHDSSAEIETLISGWDPQRTKLFMEDSLSESIENNFSSINPGGSKVYQTSIVDQPAQSEQQLKTLAETQTQRINAMRNYVIGQAEGSSDLYPGMDIELEGLLTLDNGKKYRLTQVSHSINPFSGFITEFSSQPPVLKKRSKSTLVTYGIVSQISDPEGTGRVKVCLPTYNNIESNWLEVLIPGAGDNKGIIALPAIDDKVLLIMLHERIEQAIVLGGLYGETALPDEIIVDGEVSRYSILTPGGQALRLDDKEEKISLINQSESTFELKEETAMMSTLSGNRIAMSDDELLVNSQGPLVIQAPGNTVTIRASRINFEEG
ncbi:MAG: phage baseplate assembly protein V [Gammaproteobacteria bacterium]|nr:phage baseplate assembly protein V [Gammaproteobacteria bacterium]